MGKVKLGDIAVLINGDRGKNYPSQKEIITSGGIPFVNAGHLNGRAIEFEAMNYITPEKYEKLNSGKFQQNDILYCLRGSLGKKALINDNIYGAIASSLVIIRPNLEKVRPQYLMLALETLLIKEQLFKFNNGSSQPNLSAKSVKEYKLELPDLFIQDSIISKLEKVRNLIEDEKQEKLLLDNLIQARFVEMFGDPITNSKLLPIEKIEERYFLKAGITTKAEDIHDYLKAGDRILDIGAGTGRYSVALSQEGYEVDAIELVKYNLGMLKAKKSNVKAYQGTALDLSRYQDETFDLTLLFGPMYHLFSYEDKLKALSEAKRVTKTGGVILVAYVMNDYSVLVHGFRDGHIKEALKSGKIDEHFQTQTNIDDLYSYVRIELINQLNQDLNLKRIKIIAADGPADYMRPILNKMDDETFELFMQYHLSTCERLDMIGVSSHTLDILRKV